MKKRNILVMLALTLITIAQTLVSVNACTAMAYETEIPEALK